VHSVGLKYEMTAHARYEEHKMYEAECVYCAVRTESLNIV